MNRYVDKERRKKYLKEYWKKYRKTKKRKEYQRLYMIEYRKRNVEKVKKNRIKWESKNKGYSSRRVAMKKLIKRDGAVCKLCGANERLTINHIIPCIVLGKKNDWKDLNNLEILCLHCNIKSYQTLVKKALKQYFRIS